MNIILFLGISDDMDFTLRNKILQSNRISILVFFLLITYAILYYFNAPILLPIFYVSAALLIVYYVLMFLKFHTLGRFILAVLPTVMVGALYVSLSQGNNDILLGAALIVFSFTLFPFLFFDLKEIVPLSLAFAICSITVATHKISNELIDIKLDNTFMRTPLMDTINTIVAIIALVIPLFYLSKEKLETENKNLVLLDEMDSKKTESDLSKTELEKTLSEIQNARLEDDRRNWAATGIAKFTMIMQEEESLEKLFTILISNIVKYVGANQGAFYLIEVENDEDKYIRLEAAYAYNKKKYFHQRFNIKEGLLGQCYLEKKKIFLKNVPQNYIRITSGLGEANPKCIFLMPLIFNNHVEGILELASFTVFQDFEIDFISRLSENIAALLRNVRINEKTRSLLEESQQQSEEMRAQEEEMRQNMEELQATQEHQHRLEKELKEKLEVTQQQTEELLAQEEEMRQNMEELQATQEHQYKLEEELREKLEISQQQAEEMSAQEEEMRQTIEELKATQEHQNKLEEELREKLEISQQQAEEMSAQEEEMRQTIEELQATQEHQNKLEEELREKLEISRQQAEELHAQEEEMLKTIEKMEATQEQQNKLELDLRDKLEELEESQKEVIKIKNLETDRADNQVDKINKINQQEIDKLKIRERELLEIIKKLEMK